MAEHRARISAPAEGIPALHGNSEALNMPYHLAVLIVGVDFVLYKGGLDFNLRQKAIGLPDIIAGNASRAHFSVLYRPFDCAVCFNVVVCGVVQQHHVDMPDIQLFECLVYRPPGMGILVGIQLCDDENLFARHARTSHALADFALVAVKGSRVYQAVAALQGLAHGISADGTGQTVRPQSDDGHLISAV